MSLIYAPFANFLSKYGSGLSRIFNTNSKIPVLTLINADGSAVYGPGSIGDENFVTNFVAAAGGSDAVKAFDLSNPVPMACLVNPDGTPVGNPSVNPALYRVGNYVKTTGYNPKTTGIGSTGVANYLPGTTSALYSIFENPQAYTADRIGASVVTADAAGHFRIAIYSVNSDGDPGTKIYETGELSGAATGGVEETPDSPITIPAGWLYAVAISNSSTLVLAATMNGAQALSQGIASANTAYCNGTFAHTYANPLPDNPTGLAVNTSNPSAGVLAAFFRIASLL